MTEHKLKLSTINGVLWNFCELTLRRGSGAITTLVLAWFLTPSDFGLIAMMAVFLALANSMVTGGLGQALIRKVNASEIDFDTVFLANIFFAFIVYGLLFVSSPSIAAFYQEPALVEMVRVVGIVLYFNAATVVQRSILSRNLNFKLQLKVSLPATVISGGLAIAFAYLGFGVWSLIIQTITSSILNFLFYWRLSLWRPNFHFSWNVFKELFSFGGYLLLNQIVSIPYKNMYVIVIAKLFSPYVAGLYFFSEKIRGLLIDQLVNSIQTVTYPALAKVQDEQSRLKSGYRQVISVMTFSLFPALIFIAALVEDAFQVFLPEQWWAASTYVQLMCLASLLNPLNATNLNILQVCGKTNLLFYLGLLKKIMGISIFIISIQYGIVAVLLGQILNSVLAYLLNSFYSKKLIGYSLTEQLMDFLPGLALAGLIGLVIWYFQRLLNWSLMFELIVLSALGGTLYLVLAQLINLRGMALSKDLIMAKIKRRNE